jgi:uncharacterized membrane protein
LTVSGRCSVFELRPTCSAKNAKTRCQISPRLLRNFLRDRPNQVVLSAFVATFAYCAAGLYTVGVSGGSRTAALESVRRTVELPSAVTRRCPLTCGDEYRAAPKSPEIGQSPALPRLAVSGAVPGWVVPVMSRCSGYVQAVHPGTLLPCAARCAVFLQMRPRVGEYVVAGTTLAWV